MLRYILPALELGCERLIYTAFVELCNKHEDVLASGAPNKTSTITVFRLSLLFKTGVDCGTVLDV
jgi:hypothetical protein